MLNYSLYRNNCSHLKCRYVDSSGVGRRLYPWSHIYIFIRQFFLDDINSSMVTMNSFDETITTLSCCRLSIATLQFFSSMIFNADIKLIDTMNSLDALGCQLLLYNFSLLLRKDEIEISFTLNGRMLWMTSLTATNILINRLTFHLMTGSQLRCRFTN